MMKEEIQAMKIPIFHEVLCIYLNSKFSDVNNNIISNVRVRLRVTDSDCFIRMVLIAFIITFELLVHCPSPEQNISQDKCAM